MVSKIPKILEFTDLKTKKKFRTSKFSVKTTKKGRRFAVAMSPSGRRTALFLPK